MHEDDARDPGCSVPQSQVEAVERSQTLKEFVNEALQEKLASKKSAARPGEPEWMQGFGTLRRLRKERERIQHRIREAFDLLEPEDRA